MLLRRGRIYGYIIISHFSAEISSSEFFHPYRIAKYMIKHPLPLLSCTHLSYFFHCQRTSFEVNKQITKGNSQDKFSKKELTKNASQMLSDSESSVAAFPFVRSVASPALELIQGAVGVSAITLGCEDNGEQYR